jgi:magnesium-transporting ATPase (P-type)
MNQQLTDNGKTPEIVNQEKSKKRKDFWRGVGLSILMLIVFFVNYVALEFTSLISFDTFILIQNFVIAIGIAILTISLAFKRPRIVLGILASIGFIFALLVILFIILAISGECFGMC